MIARRGGAVLLLLLLLDSSPAAAAPILFSAALPPVGANQTFLATGVGLGDAYLHLCRSDDGSCVDLASISSPTRDNVPKPNMTLAGMLL